MKKETSGDRIRIRRKMHEQTQKQLADRIHVSHVAISQWEKNETLPRGENLLKLAEALGCAPAYLVEGDGPVFTHSAFSGLHQIPQLAQADVVQWLSNPAQVKVSLMAHNDISLSDKSFALQLQENAMTPACYPGDVVIIDPLVNPLPGDIVLATQQRNTSLLRTYRPRGTHAGVGRFDLAPQNIDYPVLHSAEDDLRVIGTLMELRRYRQR